MKENEILIQKSIIPNLDLRLNEVMDYLLKKNPKDFKTQQQVSDAIGFSRPNLSAALKGRQDYLTENIVNKFCSAFPEINKAWLLTGEGDMLTPSQSFTDFLNDYPAPEPKMNRTVEAVNERISQIKNKKNGVTPVAQDGYMMVEYQDLSVAAGVMGGANPDLLPETKRRLVPHEYENGNYLVVRVDGDSMDNGTNYSIPDGCEILIKEFTYEQGQPLPIRNNLFVIVTREGTVLKQIIKHDTTNEVLTLHSFNPKYKDYTVSMEDVLQIFVYRKITSSRPPIPDINQ